MEPGERDPRLISGEVFSARTFFEQCASEASHPDGCIPFAFESSTSGVHDLGTKQQSLIWIDGIYGGSLTQEQFFESLLNGETPTPLTGAAPRTAHSRVKHVAPACLVTGRQTILTACGLVETVLNHALKSHHCRCAGCSALLTRFHSPLQVLDAILRDHRGMTVSIYAESNNPHIAEWAASRGLRTTAFPGSHEAVFLDRIACGAEADASLVSLLHSAWRIPAIRFACSESPGVVATRYYAPAGWCASCSTPAQPARRRELLTLLTHGETDKTERKPEALLTFDSSLTVRHLLTVPIRELPLFTEASLARALELLRELHLDSHSLGALTTTLDSRELAKLAIVATLLSASDPHDHVVIDLPSGIVAHDDVARVTKLLDHHGATYRISILGGPVSSKPQTDRGVHITSGSGPELACVPLPQGTNAEPCVHQLRVGDLVQVSRDGRTSQNTFQQILADTTLAFEHTASPALVVPIPVFSSASASTSVVGEDLGIVEPLAQLYAASLDARMHGLTAKDFSLFRTRSARYVCDRCKGLGVVCTRYQALPRPLAGPCPTCRGARGKPPVSTTLFRGVSFSTILNQSMASSAPTLSALSKARRALKLINALELQHLPLGMPIALLSSSELRRLRLACALQQARSSKPVVVVVEAPDVGLSGRHQAGLTQLRDAALREEPVAWIEVR